jgi:hypothetical protein
MPSLYLPLSLLSILNPYKSSLLSWLVSSCIIGSFDVIPSLVISRIFFFFLIINIMEATIEDFKSKRIWNGLNGIILLATQILCMWDNVVWVTDPGYYLVRPNSFILFGLAYTLWNFNFVNNRFGPEIATMHFGVLVAPLLGALIQWDPQLWLSFRAISLTQTGILQVAFRQKIANFLHDEVIDGWFNQLKNSWVLQLVVFLLHLGFCLACVLVQKIYHPDTLYW